MNEKIRKLQEQIEEERKKINNCKHDFGDSFYDPEEVMEGYGSVQDGAGSDPHWSYAGYHKVAKARWTRVCKKCGFEQHTYKQAPIIEIKGYGPDFRKD